MKNIAPVTLWIQGGTKTANVFSLQSIADDLSTFAQFYYRMGAKTQEPDQPEPSVVWLQDGNLTMNGQTYTDWNNEPDVNEWAYIWATQQLNLTIVTP